MSSGLTCGIVLYMSWASQRQFNILSIMGIILLGVFVVILIPLVNKKPTCFDTKKNGTEFGVDCGGECSLQCKEFTQDPVIKWQRSYEIVPGFYNAVAYIENQNFQAGVKEVAYKFKLYDQNRVLIVEKSGSTFIEPNKGMVVFEQQIPVGNTIPTYTTFELQEAVSWHKTDTRYDDMVIEVSEQLFNTDDIKPRFSAMLRNASQVFSISKIDVYVLAYDAEGNVVQVGKTVIPKLNPREKKQIFIVWQKVFETTPVRFEVISRYNPFTQEYPKK